LVQAFLKKWWIESDFKAPNLPLSLRLKGSGCHYYSIYNNTEQNRSNSCQSQVQYMYIIAMHYIIDIYRCRCGRVLMLVGITSTYVFTYRSPLNSCVRSTIQHYLIKVVSFKYPYRKDVILSGYSGFLQQGFTLSP
jgi:hypothetical protein